MTKPICVLGSNSFSGASFCKYLLENGFSVLAISRSEEPIVPLLPYKWLASSQLAFHKLDINHDLNEIEALLDKHKPEYIYNFAAQSMVAQSWEVPEDWFQTNAVSTIKLHNTLRQKDYLSRYIHVSTPEVYGSCSGSVIEHENYRPSTPYAVSRAATDMSLRTFFDVHQFPVVFTRAANVYGEGQQLYRIIPKTIMSILKGIKLPLHGGGYSLRSFIHINDVAEATHRIATQGNLGEIYHISSNAQVSIRQLVQLICQKLGADFEEVCDITEDRAGKDSAYLVNDSKLRESLGWRDEVTLEDGLNRTIQWVETNFEVLSRLPLVYEHKP